jgi:hypothetical protein
MTTTAARRPRPGPGQHHRVPKHLNQNQIQVPPSRPRLRDRPRRRPEVVESLVAPRHVLRQTGYPLAVIFLGSRSLPPTPRDNPHSHTAEARPAVVPRVPQEEVSNSQPGVTPNHRWLLLRVCTWASL